MQNTSSSKVVLSSQEDGDELEIDIPQLPASDEKSLPNPNVPLPLDIEGILKLTANDFVSNRAIILGQTGWGKGNAGALIAEHLLEHGLPMTVVDLEGEAWSFKELHSNLLVIGRSAHADREYSPAQMGRLAELSVERGFSVVLDLSEYEEEEYYALLVPYLKSLWAVCGRKRTPYHLIVDEVHEFVPQVGKTPIKQTLIRVAKQGRKRGLGIIAMSQETASVDNQLLKQTGIRILLPVSYDADFERYKTLIPGMSREAIEKTIPYFPPGKGYVVYNHTPALVQLLRRRTFDPSETPKLGTGAQEPVLQEVDEATLHLLDDALPDTTHEVLERLDRATLIQRLRVLLARQSSEPRLLSEQAATVPDAEDTQLQGQMTSLQKQLDQAKQEITHLRAGEEKGSSAMMSKLAHLEEELAKKEFSIARLEEHLSLASRLTVTLTGIPSLEEIVASPHVLRVDQAHVQHVTVSEGKERKAPTANGAQEEQELLVALEQLTQRLAQLTQWDAEMQRLREKLARLAHTHSTHPTFDEPSASLSNQKEGAQDRSEEQHAELLHVPQEHTISLSQREQRRLSTLLQELHHHPYSRFHRELLVLLLSHESKEFSYEDIAKSLRYALPTVANTSTTALQEKGLIGRTTSTYGYVSHFPDFCRRKFPGVDEQFIREQMIAGLIERAPS